MLQTGSSPSSATSATSATSAAMQHCRYAGRGRDCSVEIIGKIARYGEVGVCSSADSSMFYFKSHGRPRKCRWKHHWNKMKPGLWHSCLTPRLHLKHKGCSLERQEFIELCVCACIQVRPSEPTCFPFLEFTAPPSVAGIGLGAEKLEGAHSFFSTA